MRRGEGFGGNFGPSLTDEILSEYAKGDLDLAWKLEHKRRGQKPSDDWQTPPHIIKALGHFDLDPCASLHQHHQTATTIWTVLDNGFMRPWHGRVWLNPPYGRKTIDWVRRLGDHGNGIALVFARVDTPLFQDEIFVKATGLLFLRRRIFFIQRDGRRAKSSGGAPSVFVAYGQQNFEALRLSGLRGSLLSLQAHEGTILRMRRRADRGMYVPSLGGWVHAEVEC